MEERDGDALAYEADLHGWALRQAGLLQAGRLDEVDAANVADEIESLGRAQASSLQARCREIAASLLAALHRPWSVTREGAGAILRERMDAAGPLRDSPSLGAIRPELFREAYRQARMLAAAETGLPAEAFPADPPFTVEELSSEDFKPWPEPDA